MKKIFTPILVLSLVALSAFSGQGGIDDIINAIRAGNSAELSRYFDDNIEMTVSDKSNNYSKAQAQLIIKDFFKNAGVKGFELKHKGDSPGGHFAIGTLQTNDGNFRTNVFTKMKNNAEVIKEIRFQSIE